MRRILLAAVAIAPIAACATAPDPSAPGSGQTVFDPNTDFPFLAIIGTPIYIAFKVPVCAVSAAVSLPLAGMSELNGSGDAGGREMRRSLSTGLAQSCGPPYVLTP
jgi:hypothetical protein